MSFTPVAFHFILLQLNDLVINYFIPNTVHSRLLLSLHPNHPAKFQPWEHVNIHLHPATSQQSIASRKSRLHRLTLPAPSRPPGDPRLRAFLLSVKAPIPHVLLHIFSRLIIFTATHLSSLSAADLAFYRTEKREPTAHHQVYKLTLLSFHPALHPPLEDRVLPSCSRPLLLPTFSGAFCYQLSSLWLISFTSSLFWILPISI